MALAFPLNPQVNDEYALGAITWRWDGSRWRVVRTFNVTESAAIQDAVSSALSTIDNTFQFKGTIGTGGTVEALPTIHGIGWVFRVLDDSTLAGQQVETGDLLFAVQERNDENNENNDWVVMQGNIDFGNFAKNIIPATDEAIDLGSNTKKFNELYLSGGTIYLGEETISVNAQGSLQLPSAVQIGNIRMTDNEGSFELMNMSTNAVPTSSNVLSDTVVLTQASWENTEPSTITVSFAGMREIDHASVDVDMSGVSFANVKAQQDNWALVYRAEGADGTITFYATDTPDVDLTVRVKVVR